jgi:signal transduction histidine kinase
MGQRVLVVEDDTDTAHVVRAYLERDGFEVEVARDGVSGLERALTDRPDLVVLDWMLPGLDGLSFLRTLRRDGALPVIMLTARTEEGDRIAGLEAGADDYVAKPFSPRELSARVRAVLRRAPAGEEDPRTAIEVAGLRIDVAHEFRTPPSNLRGYVEGLQDGVFEDQAPVLDASWRQLDRLGHLVDDLSLLLRVETGQLELHVAPIEALELAQATVASFAPDAERAGVRLEVDVRAPDTVVRADRERSLQVLANLVGNALRYTPGGGSVTIEVGAPAHGFVRFAVRDTGPGVAPEDLPNVFKRFYRGDKARSPHAGGSGIGLTIARQVVERQGGEIGVTSPPGEGATFHSTLPEG